VIQIRYICLIDSPQYKFCFYNATVTEPLSRTRKKNQRKHKLRKLHASALWLVRFLMFYIFIAKKSYNVKLCLSLNATMTLCYTVYYVITVPLWKHLSCRKIDSSLKKMHFSYAGDYPNTPLPLAALIPRSLGVGWCPQSWFLLSSAQMNGKTASQILRRPKH